MLNKSSKVPVPTVGSFQGLFLMTFIERGTVRFLQPDWESPGSSGTNKRFLHWRVLLLYLQQWIQENPTFPLQQALLDAVLKTLYEVASPRFSL